MQNGLFQTKNSTKSQDLAIYKAMQLTMHDLYREDMFSNVPGLI